MTALATFVRTLYVADDSSKFFPFTPDDNVTTEEEIEMSLVTIHQYLEMTIKSLHRMLTLTFMHFVSHMVHNDSLQLLLSSYFAHRQRSYRSHTTATSSSSLSIAAGQCHILLKEMDKLVYLLHLRLVSVSDVDNHSSSSNSSSSLATISASSVLRQHPNLSESLRLDTTHMPSTTITTASNKDIFSMTFLQQYVMLIFGDLHSPVKSSVKSAARLSIPVVMDLCALIATSHRSYATLLLSRLFILFDTNPTPVKSIVLGQTPQSNSQSNRGWGAQWELVLTEIQHVLSMLEQQLIQTIAPYRSQVTRQSSAATSTATTTSATATTRSKQALAPVDLSASKSLSPPGDQPPPPLTAPSFTYPQNNSLSSSPSLFLSFQIPHLHKPNSIHHVILYSFYYLNPII